jgi:hypothetical protein
MRVLKASGDPGYFSDCGRSGEGQPRPRILRNNTVAAGAELYTLYGATCYGVDGGGDGPATEAMKRRPPSLTTISRRNRGEFPEFRVAHVIDGFEVTSAHGSREMPVWGEFFHGTQRDNTLLKREHNLTEYIRSIQR